MSSAAEATLVFPSVLWFQALQQLVNADPDFRRIGSIDASMAVKVGPKIIVIIFEAFECLEVREGTEEDLVVQKDVDRLDGRGHVRSFGDELTTVRDEHLGLFLLEFILCCAGKGKVAGD